MSIGRMILSMTVGRVLPRLVGAHHSGPTRVGRRSFVRNAALGAVGVNSAITGGLFVRWLWPNKTGDFGKVLDVASASVPEVGGTPYVSSAGKFYLVHTEDGVMALYWKCVHLGCTVPPYNQGTQSFNCGCHGSIYAYNGDYLGGPAPRPMDYMATTIDAATGNVQVDTGDIRTRSGYDPSQATPI